VTSGSDRAPGGGRPPLPVSRPSLPPLEDYVRLLQDIWDRRMLSNFAQYAQEFERKAQEYLGNPRTRAAVNCDIGLVLSLAALGLPEGSECLVQSFTFNSTINAILWNRLRPVFVDIDPHTLNVDCDDLERRIGPATRALVVTHIFGSPLPIERVIEIAHRRSLRVVVDAAHAYGATHGGVKVGDPSLGDFQVFSFSGTKQVTCAEGGLVAIAREEDLRAFEYLRAYGFHNDYISRFVGLNAKLSEIHAALGCLALDEIESVMEARRAKADRYRAALSRAGRLRFQEVPPQSRSSYKDFAILCAEGRDELATRLDSLGIQTKKYFRPLHSMPAYERFATAKDDLGDTQSVADAVLCLPMFNELADADIDRICESILDFYGPR
jgi:dTDP-4-amino-4,6-dideoxygalactose transaminase